MRFSYAVIAILLLCSCGGNRADLWLDGKERERKPDTFQPEIFISLKPTKPYREISIVRLETHSNTKDQIRLLKNFCRARGGDAILVAGAGGDSRTSTNFFGGINSQQFTNAVVIEYTDAPAKP